jgi:hypothetical protein
VNFFATHAAPANDPVRSRALVACRLVARLSKDEPAPASLAFSLGLPFGVSAQDVRARLALPEGRVSLAPVVAEKFGDAASMRLEFDALPSSWTELSCTFTLAVSWERLLAYGLGLDVPVALETASGTLSRALHDPMRVPVESALGVQLLLRDGSGRFGFSGLEVEPGETFVLRMRYQRDAAHYVKDLKVLLDPFADADEEARARVWHARIEGVDLSGATACTCEPRCYVAPLEDLHERFARSRGLVPPFSEDAVWLHGSKPLDVPYLLAFDLGWRDASDWHFYLPRAEELFIDVSMSVPHDARPGTAAGPVAAVAQATLVREVGDQSANATTFDISFMPRVVAGRGTSHERIRLHP